MDAWVRSLFRLEFAPEATRGTTRSLPEAVIAQNTVMVVLGTTIHEFASNDRISLVETRGWSD
jgi:hypothetical protein